MQVVVVSGKYSLFRLITNQYQIYIVALTIDLGFTAPHRALTKSLVYVQLLHTPTMKIQFINYFIGMPVIRSTIRAFIVDVSAVKVNMMQKII